MKHNTTNYPHMTALFMNELLNEFPDHQVPAGFQVHIVKTLIDSTYPYGYHEEDGQPCREGCPDRIGLYSFFNSTHDRTED